MRLITSNNRAGLFMIPVHPLHFIFCIIRINYQKFEVDSRCKVICGHYIIKNSKMYVHICWLFNVSTQQRKGSQNLLG